MHLSYGRSACLYSRSTNRILEEQGVRRFLPGLPPTDSLVVDPLSKVLGTIGTGHSKLPVRYSRHISSLGCVVRVPCGRNHSGDSTNNRIPSEQIGRASCRERV